MTGTVGVRPGSHAPSDAVAKFVPSRNGLPQVIYRITGDSYLLVEYGEMVLDLDLRVRIYSLEAELRRMAVPGLLELSPGVRSVLITYDPLSLSLKKLLRILDKAELRVAIGRWIVFWGDGYR